MISAANRKRLLILLALTVIGAAAAWIFLSSTLTAMKEPVTEATPETADGSDVTETVDDESRRDAINAILQKLRDGWNFESMECTGAGKTRSVFARQDILSVKYKWSKSCEGDMNPESGEGAVIYDLKTGNEVKIGDLVDTNSGYYGFINGLYQPPADEDCEVKASKRSLHLNASGAEVIFSFPSSAGVCSQSVRFPLEKLQPYIPESSILKRLMN